MDLVWSFRPVPVGGIRGSWLYISSAASCGGIGWLSRCKRTAFVSELVSLDRSSLFRRDFRVWIVVLPTLLWNLQHEPFNACPCSLGFLSGSIFYFYFRHSLYWWGGWHFSFHRTRLSMLKTLSGRRSCNSSPGPLPRFVDCSGLFFVKKRTHWNILVTGSKRGA